MYKTVQINYILRKRVLCDCISMCFDICAINIRVSIRVRGLHLVFFFFEGRPIGAAYRFHPISRELVTCDGQN